jgi:hypothetical protein
VLTWTFRPTGTCRKGVDVSLVSEHDSCLYISGKGGIRGKEHSDTRQCDIITRTLFVYCKQREKEKEDRVARDSVVIVCT